METPLTIDFLESGVGETILITFPDEGVGIVDAHDPRDAGRPALLDLVRNRKVHFVCLTHPHADHGMGLVDILKCHPDINCFWHSLSDVSTFVFAAGQVQNYRSPFREVVREFHANWGRFLTQIFGTAGKRGLPYRKIRADLESQEIAGVKIHFLGPEEQEQNVFTAAYQDIASGRRTRFPDHNRLSVIMALEYGDSVVLLGADALKRNWKAAIKKYKRLKLPRAVVIKIPHHGASNALETRKRQPSYLDACSKDTVAVLFAGDVDHPDPAVENILLRETKLSCLVNGRRSSLSSRNSNPLDIAIPGAVAVSQNTVPCQPRITFQLGSNGSVVHSTGVLCSSCRYH